MTSTTSKALHWPKASESQPLMTHEHQQSFDTMPGGILVTHARVLSQPVSASHDQQQGLGAAQPLIRFYNAYVKPMMVQFVAVDLNACKS